MIKAVKILVHWTQNCLHAEVAGSSNLSNAALLQLPGQQTALSSLRPHGKHQSWAGKHREAQKLTCKALQKKFTLTSISQNMTAAKASQIKLFLWIKKWWGRQNGERKRMHFSSNMNSASTNKGKMLTAESLSSNSACDCFKSNFALQEKERTSCNGECTQRVSEGFLHTIHRFWWTSCWLLAPIHSEAGMAKLPAMHYLWYLFLPFKWPLPFLLILACNSCLL